MCLGGSNTANDDGYVKLLTQMVKENETIVNSNGSYVINAGLSGNGPYRTMYEFEKTYPLSRWPNLITLEFSVNSNFDWGAAKNIDILIHFINMKYIKKSLAIPSYLVIDLWFAASYYDREFTEYHINATYNPFENMTLNEVNPNITMLTPTENDMRNYAGLRVFNRGSPSTAFITSLCRFYGYPMISTAEALFPAFTRYYATHDSADHYFKYTRDGTHLSALGVDLLVNKMIKPFLHKQLARREVYDPRHANGTEYNYDIRLFPKNEYPEFNILHEWHVWGKLDDYLATILLPGNEWTKTSLRNHPDNLHNCYGSTTENSKFKVSIPIQVRDNCSPCRIQFGYLHSWNTSYIGTARCTIYKNSPVDEINLKHEQYTAEGNVFHGNKMTDSTVRIHKMPQLLYYNASQGSRQSYTFECVNLSPKEKPLLTCITSISLFSGN